MLKGYFPNFYKYRFGKNVYNFDMENVCLPRYADVYDGRYENIFVCNYGIGGNVVGQPVFEHKDCLTGKWAMVLKEVSVYFSTILHSQLNYHL